LSKTGARQISSPDIAYGRDKRATFDKQTPATWNLDEISDGLLEVPHARIQKLHFTVIGTSKYYDQYLKGQNGRDGFLGVFQNTLKKYGFNQVELEEVLPRIPLKAIPDVQLRRMYWAQHLDNAYESITPQPPILLVLLPDGNRNLYADVKWWSDCCCGVPTVCIKADKLEKAMTGSKSGGVDHKLLANLW